MAVQIVHHGIFAVVGQARIENRDDHIDFWQRVLDLAAGLIHMSGEPAEHGFLLQAQKYKHKKAGDHSSRWCPPCRASFQGLLVRVKL